MAKRVTLTQQQIDEAIDNDAATREAWAEHIALTLSFPPVLKESDVSDEQRAAEAEAWQKVLYAARQYHK